MSFFHAARKPRSLAGQLFAMQAVLVAVIVAWCAVFAYVNDRAQARGTATREVLIAARSVADAPSVRAAIRTADPTAELQPYAERVRRDTRVDFVTIMDTHGIRWTHPDPKQIGMRFLGTTAPALRGKTFTETYTGTLGPSTRAVTPIREGGRIVGLVSVGITVERISTQVTRQLRVLSMVAGAALVLGALGTYVINARLRRHTHGLDARGLSRMYDYHQAALHAVHEGLLMLDGRRRIALINDGGRELLGLDASAVGRPVADLGLPPPLTGALLASEPRVDEVHLTEERVVVVNTRPVVGGERSGTVVTLRDHTELQTLSGELDSERGFTQALRSQAHEAANRLHTVVSLIELGRVDQAVEFATSELELAQALTDQVVGAVGEPVLAALLLGKAAQANERGVELVLAPDSRMDDGVLPPTLSTRDLVTILGNLVDNAVEAAGAGGGGLARDTGGGPARVTVTARVEEAAGADAGDGRGDGPRSAAELLLRVRDTGPGVAEERMEEVFRRGWSTNGPGRGLGLALVRQAVHRARGSVEVSQGDDGGAEFTVRLPLTAAGPATGADECGPGRLLGHGASAGAS
ncbi:sensor histidine kinase [Streptomyces sp. NBC_01497]|uniref:sensor histidine kinase n=1 Tax=Streptomyces sp. NBC_01497 TaxID=2903885 RepID=UPI002E32F5FD|nr:sensor histidine kinase [Streptomyces sp. NBC_01497]